MREKFAQIPLSPQLEGRVDQALREVRRLHRGQVARRWGSALGSLVAVMGVLLGLAAFSPATAAKIPLIGQWLGGLFYEVNYDSKVGTTGAFVETYDALEDVNVSALTDSGAWELTFLQGYTDGKTVVLSLALDGPQEALDRWDNILVEGYGLTSAAATVNGEQAQVEGVNSFRQKEGTWVSTMEIQVPESQWEAEALELSVTLKGPSGWAQGGGEQEPLEGSFTGSFTLAVDRSRQFSFVCQAEQNGAQVFAVSGGPLETVLSVEKPFWGWGDSNVDTRCWSCPMRPSCGTTPERARNWAATTTRPVRARPPTCTSTACRRGSPRWSCGSMSPPPTPTRTRPRSPSWPRLPST